MTNPCPKCGKELAVWISQATFECGCACDNRDCPLVGLEVSGNSTQEALDRFHGEALRREARKERARR